MDLKSAITQSLKAIFTQANLTISKSMANRQRKEGTKERTNEWVNKWMNEWMKDWTEKWENEKIKLLIKASQFSP